MECPYCKKEIFGMTGLQELQKFQKHLNKCKKNPALMMKVDSKGNLKTKTQSMMDALNIRHESGQ